MKNKQKKVTSKLQKLVKKRKTPKVVIKAGSVRYSRKSSSSPASDYYPSGFYNN